MQRKNPSSDWPKLWFCLSPWGSKSCSANYNQNLGWNAFVSYHTPLPKLVYITYFAIFQFRLCLLSKSVNLLISQTVSCLKKVKTFSCVCVAQLFGPHNHPPTPILSEVQWSGDSHAGTCHDWNAGEMSLQCGSMWYRWSLQWKVQMLSINGGTTASLSDGRISEDIGRHFNLNIKRMWKKLRFHTKRQNFEKL